MVRANLARDFGWGAAPCSIRQWARFRWFVLSLPAGAALVSGHGVAIAQAQIPVSVPPAWVEQKVLCGKQGRQASGGAVPLELNRWFLQARPAATTAFSPRNSRRDTHNKCRRKTRECIRKCRRSMTWAAWEVCRMAGEGSMEMTQSMLLVRSLVCVFACLSGCALWDAREQMDARRACISTDARERAHARTSIVVSLDFCFRQSSSVCQQRWSSGRGGLKQYRSYDADFAMQSIVTTDMAPILVILRVANMHVRAGRLCACLVFPPSLLPCLPPSFLSSFLPSFPPSLLLSFPPSLPCLDAATIRQLQAHKGWLQSRVTQLEALLAGQSYARPR